jgi:hypothetical protein
MVNPGGALSMKSALVLVASVLAAAGSVACGETPSPAAPSTSPFVTQFSGLWSGGLQLSRVTGGECVGPELAAQSAALDQGTITITQDDSDVSAIIRSATTGLTCSYQGNGSAFTYSLSATTCNGALILHQCTNGNARVLEFVGSTMTGTVAAGTTSGTVTTTYNVFSEHTSEAIRRPIAGLTVQHQFSAVRR